ncbi:MAG: hypothetical protein IPM92_05255 [Saprospiraceae bacterium]|nr:hypothetical protein [Saprospiraceae bacterium]
MFYAIALVFLTLSSGFGQHSILSEGIHPSSFARANTGICLWNNYINTVNPALLSGLTSSSLSVYARNYYFTKGVLNQNILLQFKIDKLSGASLLLSKDGSQDYAEYLLKLSYGRQLGQHTKMGIAVFGWVLNQFAIKNKMYVNVQWGITTRINPNLMAGCVLSNPLYFHKSVTNSPPFHFSSGINYRIYDGLELLAEIQKHGFTALSTSVGLNYQASLHLQLFAGVRTSGPQISVGIMYALRNKFKCNMAVENHPLLGPSLNTGIDYFMIK